MKHLDRRRDPGRSAFTLLELLVVIFLIAIVAAILLPTINRTHHGSSCRVKCGSNLRQIGQALLMYSNENKGAYPQLRYNVGGPPTFHWDASNGGTVVNPFVDKPWADYDNDVLMAIFLLIRTQDITPEVFVCPSSNAERDTYGTVAGACAQDKASFSKPGNLSYSLANPYADQAAVDKGYKWNSTLGAEFAVAADLNPGVGDNYDATLPTIDSSAKEMMKSNSRNHQGAGENVLFGDGHVEFTQTPFVGMRRDNIYTVSGSTDGTVTTSKVIVGSPKGGHDSVLLPTAK